MLRRKLPWSVSIGDLIGHNKFPVNWKTELKGDLLKEILWDYGINTKVKFTVDDSWKKGVVHRDLRGNVVKGPRFVGVVRTDNYGIYYTVKNFLNLSLEQERSYEVDYVNS